MARELTTWSDRKRLIEPMEVRVSEMDPAARLPPRTQEQNYETIPTVQHGRETTYTPPTFYWLEVSDTGDFISWKSSQLPKRGDHIAWSRFGLYYHHAIVVEDSENLRVVEMKLDGAAENHSKRRTCCCSFLYKVFYPRDLYTVDEVVNRARSLTQETLNNDQEGTDGTQSEENIQDGTATTTRQGCTPWNNCEHNATWCKVNVKKSDQNFRFWGTVLSVIRRIVFSILHIVFIVILSEGVEESTSKKDIIGIFSQIGIELCYLVVVLCVILCDFKRGGNFISTNQFSKCKRVSCAIVKTFLRSMLLVFMSSFFSVYFKNVLQKRCKCVVSFLVEVALGIVGGLIGDIAGLILFFFCPVLLLCKRDP